jgi:hypothetical protein
VAVGIWGGQDRDQDHSVEQSNLETGLEMLCER